MFTPSKRLIPIFITFGLLVPLIFRSKARSLPNTGGKQKPEADGNKTEMKDGIDFEAIDEYVTAKMRETQACAINRVMVAG